MPTFTSTAERTTGLDLRQLPDAETMARDLAPWEALLVQLTNEILDIETQLTTADGFGDPSAPLMTRGEFVAWRKKALFAKQARIKVKTALVSVLKQARYLLNCQKSAVRAWDLDEIASRLVTNTSKVYGQAEDLVEAVPGDDDLADLVACLRENIDELREKLRVLSPVAQAQMLELEHRQAARAAWREASASVVASQ